MPFQCLSNGSRHLHAPGFSGSHDHSFLSSPCSQCPGSLVPGVPSSLSSLPQHCCGHQGSPNGLHSQNSPFPPISPNFRATPARFRATPARFLFRLMLFLQFCKNFHDEVLPENSQIRASLKTDVRFAATPLRPPTAKHSKRTENDKSRN